MYRCTCIIHKPTSFLLSCLQVHIIERGSRRQILILAQFKILKFLYTTITHKDKRPVRIAQAKGFHVKIRQEEITSIFIKFLRDT